MAPSVQCHKVWLTPTTRCRAVMLPRHETSGNLQGCPKLVNRSQPLVGRSSPYCGDIWRRYCCLTSFFRSSIHALVAKIQPNKVVRWCPDGESLRHFCVLYFQQAACSTFQTTTTTVLRPFFWDHAREPVPEENFWTLWCKGRLTEADTQTIRLGATPFGLTSDHLHHPQHAAHFRPAF